jgi:hypothetical protein
LPASSAAVRGFGLWSRTRRRGGAICLTLSNARFSVRRPCYRTRQAKLDWEARLHAGSASKVRVLHGVSLRLTIAIVRHN